MKRVKLGEVVKRIKDRVDICTCGLEFYIGGEHYDNGEVSIVKKGTIKGSTIGPAFHMRFKPGHVLLMSRNPHLRKAGVVDFDGICSDVSYVLESKDEKVLLQKYLPFILQTDDFWDYATAHKKGSTNFFLNWSDFEKFEFNLPLLEEQERLAKILWKIEEIKKQNTEIINSLSSYIDISFNELLNKNELCSLDYYCNNIKNSHTKNQIFNVAIDLDCIVPFAGDISFFKYEITEKSSYNKFEKNDIIFGKLRPYLGKYWISNTNGICNGEIMIFKANIKTAISGFLYLIISSKKFIEYNNKLSYGTKMPRTSWKIASKFKCPLLTIEEQDHYYKKISQIIEIQSFTRDKIKVLNNLQKQILREAFNV